MKTCIKAKEAVHTNRMAPHGRELHPCFCTIGTSSRLFYTQVNHISPPLPFARAVHARHTTHLWTKAFCGAPSISSKPSIGFACFAGRCGLGAGAADMLKKEAGKLRSRRGFCSMLSAAGDTARYAVEKDEHMSNAANCGSWRAMRPV